MKKCICCGEFIADNTIVCDYCGESQNQLVGYTQPQSTGEQLLNGLQTCENIGNTMMAVFSDFNRVNLAINEMNYQIQLIDRQLEAFKLQIVTDLQKYQMTAAILETQLNNVSSRIDKVVDKILEMDDSTLDANKLQQQTNLIGMLQQINDSFNSILFKLV